MDGELADSRFLAGVLATEMSTAVAPSNMLMSRYPFLRLGTNGGSIFFSSNLVKSID